MLRKIACISIVAATSLFATEAPTKLDKTVITATGFESPLKDEVKNVYIITSEEIESRGYKDVEEILEKAPGVNFINSGLGKTIDLRGQGNKANTSVKVLLNGMALNMLDSSHAFVPLNFLAIEDIEQIEIIPGGGAVLYGNGTSGGVVNIITKQKPRDFYANVSTKLASYSYKDFNLGLGGMASENLFLKGNFKAFDEKGYRDGDKQRGFYTSFGINYKISDNQTLAINPSYYKTRVDTTDAITKTQLNQNRKQAGEPIEQLTHKKADISAEYAIAITDKLKLNLMPYYQEISMRGETSDFTDKKLGVNLKSRYDYGSGEFISGYDYLQNKGIRERDRKFGGMHSYTLVDLKKQTHTVYFFEKHNFTDAFSLTGGYRFEKAIYDINRYSKMKMPARPPMMPKPMTIIDSIDSDKNMNNHAFEITPNFRYSDTGNVYLKFERGYISPSPTQLTDKVVVSRAAEYRLNDLKSEIFHTYEIGIRDLILGQYFSATAFITNTKDEIINEMTGGHSMSWRFYNVDETRRSGFEIYAEQNLFNNLKLSQTFSYIDAKIKKGKKAGKRVPYVSKNKFVFGVNYEPIKNFNILTDLKYYSNQFSSAYETIDAKTVVDFGLKYKFKNGFSVAGGVKNLFNEKYNDFQSEAANAYVPAPERNYYVEFKYAY
ncbi:TonB-dependent receptor [Campylobacter sp. RM16187]|uniref:TonB-dependent receptor n=1 Tax=Campylobacter sp. RM16187 TaxID=1660063 RepID=UPI0021B6CE3B|nr:TonB-dependent receptor [Campylobacter sp. RM16187]QKG29706.1 heme uptake system outer membrane receptor [Campylobacter sp. RM16187]